MAAWVAFLALSVILASTDHGVAGSAQSALSVGQMQNFTFFDAPKQVEGVSFVDAEGRKLGLADFRGKFVLVNLWATWCGPCRREMPSLDRLQARLSGGDFTVLALSQDRKGVAAVQKFLAQIGTQESRRLSLILLPGLPASSAQSDCRRPCSLIARVKVVGRLIGSAEWDSDEAARLIKSVIQDSARQSAVNQR